MNFKDITKHIFPVSIILIGIFLLFKMSVQYTEVNELFKNHSIQHPSSPWIVIASILIVVSGIISLLISLEKISIKSQKIISYFAVIMAIVVFYQDYKVVKRDIDYKEYVDNRRKQVRYRLEDIQKIQRIYREKYAKYADTFTEITRFLNDEKIAIVHTNGDIPEHLKDSISQKQAIEMGYIKTDTVYISILEELFLSDKAQENRNRRPFYIDSLRYIPMTIKNDKPVEFFIKTSFIENGGVKQPVLLIKDIYPLTKDTLLIGSLNESTLNGNWSSR